MRTPRDACATSRWAWCLRGQGWSYLGCQWMHSASVWARRVSGGLNLWWMVSLRAHTHSHTHTHTHTIIRAIPRDVTYSSEHFFEFGRLLYENYGLLKKNSNGTYHDYPISVEGNQNHCSVMFYNWAIRLLKRDVTYVRDFRVCFF